jgi:nucleoside phosphorylase
VDPHRISLLILTAVELEAATLARHLELSVLPGLPFRGFGRGHVRMASIGPGAGRLAERWPILLDGLDYPLVVSAGLCGGLDPALSTGDVVVPDQVLSPGGDRFDRDLALAGGGAPASRGRLVTVRQVVETPADKAALRARTGGVAVDMESADIADAATRARLPWTVVRGVSDAAGDTVPRALLGLMGPDGRLRLAHPGVLRLGWPQNLRRALGLARGTRLALSRVGRVLAELAIQPASFAMEADPEQRGRPVNPFTSGPA